MSTEVVATQERPVATASSSAGLPMRLIEMAVTSNASMDQLERLMSLQERHEANEARRAYVQAMARFKQQPVTIVKDRAVGYEGRGGEFVGYKHATLASVTRTLVPALAEHGLSHSWSVNQEGGVIAVRCTLTHELGHSEHIEMKAPPDASGKKNAIQQIGSTITYLQRYTLLAITGMSTEEMDDDGHGAGGGDTEIPVGDVVQEFYSDASFYQNLDSWAELIRTGKRDAQTIVAFVESSSLPMTDVQKQKLSAIKPTPQEAP